MNDGREKIKKYLKSTDWGEEKKLNAKTNRTWTVLSLVPKIEEWSILGRPTESSRKRRGGCST